MQCKRFQRQAKFAAAKAKPLNRLGFLQVRRIMLAGRLLLS
jgi:hypothetical protein